MKLRNRNVELLSADACRVRYDCSNYGQFFTEHIATTADINL